MANIEYIRLDNEGAVSLWDNEGPIVEESAAFLEGISGTRSCIVEGGNYNVRAFDLTLYKEALKSHYFVQESYDFS